MNEQSNQLQPKSQSNTAAQSYRLTRAMRLSGAPAFKAVYDGNTKRHAGPLTFFARPNGLTHLRLGLSVSRRVGNAVKRSGIKRLLREAFRTTQHQAPGGYDIVIVVRPHAPIRFAEYQQIMVSTLHALDQRHRRKTMGDQP